jgi:hypothetical protein
MSMTQYRNVFLISTPAEITNVGIGAILRLGNGFIDVKIQSLYSLLCFNSSNKISSIEFDAVMKIPIEYEPFCSYDTSCYGDTLPFAYRIELPTHAFCINSLLFFTDKTNLEELFPLSSINDIKYNNLKQQQYSEHFNMPSNVIFRGTGYYINESDKINKSGGNLWKFRFKSEI